MIRVTLVDDHAIIREGMKMMLTECTDITIIGGAGSMKELQASPQLLASTDVLVLDMFLETEDAGLKLIVSLTQEYPQMKILIVSMYTSPLLIQQCLDLGAKGYVTKSEATEYIKQAIHTVYENNTFLSPSTHSMVLENTEKETRLEDQYMLTNREIDILNLLGKGLTTRRICKHLSISSSTVGTHIENLKAKLNIPDKNMLLRYAIEREQRLGMFSKK